MLHANLKAVCSPQIASMGGGGGGGGGYTGAHSCAYSGIFNLEELLSVFYNQVLWFECSPVNNVCWSL